KCAELLPKAHPLGSLLRTFLESSTWNSTVCYLTWRHSATPQGRLLFQLAPWMPDTEETECGLWPTPHGFSPDGKSNGPSGNELGHAVNRAVKLWPTPKAAEAGPDFAKLDRSATGISLQTAVKLWPTVTAQDAKNDAGPSQWQRNTPPLNVAVKMYPTPDVG